MCVRELSSCFVFVFFFKQKTAYEIPKRDWSSDVCSSDLGLIPLFAVETLDPELMKELPDFAGRLEWFLNYRPDLAKLVSRWQEHGAGERRLLSLLRGHRMKCLLRRMLDETEFLSDYGVLRLPQAHPARPLRLPHQTQP